MKVSLSHRVKHNNMEQTLHHLQETYPIRKWIPFFEGQKFISKKLNFPLHLKMESFSLSLPYISIPFPFITIPHIKNALHKKLAEYLYGLFNNERRFD